MSNDPRPSRTRCFLLLTCVCFVCAWFLPVQPVTAEEPALFDLSLEDLLDIEVTSVSKRPQSIHEAPAAIFVLTNEDLRRQGAGNIAEALRLVPGIHVARIDANKWAITARGDNGRFSNKLLVLIDGRSVYTPTFSGVYWEVQDLMLEDVDRIEIIRGPGSTLWGANAVNGVINIITKHAADTQGGLVSVGGGDFEQVSAGFRWGAQLDDLTYARVYGKTIGTGEFDAGEDSDPDDDWNIVRAGFRLDRHQSAREALTLQGGVYDGRINQKSTISRITPPYIESFTDRSTVSGGHLLGRLVHTYSPRSEISFQAYYDRSLRDDPGIAKRVADQIDYDLQHSFTTDGHKLVWGAGYRHINNDIQGHNETIRTGSPLAVSLFSLFLQDEIELRKEVLSLTAGSKFEHNEFTGVEIQPSLRMLWRPGNDHRIWSAVSRAVRTPSHVESDVGVLVTSIPPGTEQNPAPFPVAVVMTGSDKMQAEELVAYELGYRFTRSTFTADLALFLHEYDRLRSTKPGEPDVRYYEDPPYILQPTIFGNDAKSSDYGLELALTWQPGHWLRGQLAYSTIRNDELAEDLLAIQTPIDPEHQAFARLEVSPHSTVDLFGAVRYVDQCTAIVSTRIGGFQVPEYTGLDLGVDWRLRPNLMVSLHGYDLLEENHYEYAAESFSLPVQIPRRLFARLRWSF